jgi:hypothetical protein
MPSSSCAPFINAAGTFNSGKSLGTLNSAQRAACGIEAMKMRVAMAPSRFSGGRTRKQRKGRKGRKGGKSRRNRH